MKLPSCFFVCETIFWMKVDSESRVDSVHYMWTFPIDWFKVLSMNKSPLYETDMPVVPVTIRSHFDETVPIQMEWKQKKYCVQDRLHIVNIRRIRLINWVRDRIQEEGPPEKETSFHLLLSKYPSHMWINIIMALAYWSSNKNNNDNSNSTVRIDSTECMKASIQTVSWKGKELFIQNVPFIFFYHLVRVQYNLITLRIHSYRDWYWRQVWSNGNSGHIATEWGNLIVCSNDCNIN